MEIKAGMPKEELKKLLQQEIKEINLADLYDLSFRFNDETRYLPREYRKQYIESVLKVIISRFASLKNTLKTFTGEVTEKEAKEINELLSDNEDHIIYILNITVIYATYLLKRPVHLPGTVFPGLVSIYTDGKDYYCPIKKHHLDNENAVCKYCIAKVPNEDD